jgi:Trk-type K+ transport system membrane component
MNTRKIKRFRNISTKHFISKPLTPVIILVISFALVILTRIILFYLPFSVSKNQLSFVNTLYTSASAKCVTGLAIIDIGKNLSLTGQIITMFFFQLGGLGTMTFSVFFFSLMGRSISFKGREIFQSTFLYLPQTLKREYSNHTNFVFLIIKITCKSTFQKES